MTNQKYLGSFLAGALMVDLGQIRGLVEHEPAVPGDQVAQPGVDVQDGQEQVPGQQPMVLKQTQVLESQFYQFL